MWNQARTGLTSDQHKSRSPELWRTKPHQNTWSADGPGQMFRGFKCSWSWHCCHSNRCSSCLQLPWKHYGWPSVKTTHYFYVAPVRSGKKQWDSLGQTKQPALEAAVARTLFNYLFTQKAKKKFKHKGQITRNSNPLDFYSEGNLGLIFFWLYYNLFMFSEFVASQNTQATAATF